MYVNLLSNKMYYQVVNCEDEQFLPETEDGFYGLFTREFDSVVTKGIIDCVERRCGIDTRYDVTSQVRNQVRNQVNPDEFDSFENTVEFF